MKVEQEEFDEDYDVDEEEVKMYEQFMAG